VQSIESGSGLRKAAAAEGGPKKAAHNHHLLTKKLMRCEESQKQCRSESESKRGGNVRKNALSMRERP